MSFFRFYVYRHRVLFPNVARADEGFFIDQEPVTIFDADAEKDIQSFLEELFAAGNATIPTPDRSQPGSVILEVLSLKKWSVFEPEAVMFSIQHTEKSTKLWYTGRGPDRMWRRDPERQQIFSAGETGRAIAAVLEAVRLVKSGDPP